MPITIIRIPPPRSANRRTPVSFLELVVCRQSSVVVMLSAQRGVHVVAADCDLISLLDNLSVLNSGHQVAFRPHQQMVLISSILSAYTRK